MVLGLLPYRAAVRAERKDALCIRGLVGVASKDSVQPIVPQLRQEPLMMIKQTERESSKEKGRCLSKEKVLDSLRYLNENQVKAY